MIDAHVHVWDQTSLDYGWLSRAPYDSLPARVEVDDFAPLPGERALVLVEAGADGADSGLMRAAAAHPRVAAIVPALPRAADDLERLIRDDPRGVVRAVRWQAQRVPADVPFPVDELAGILSSGLAAGVGLEVVVSRARAREAIGAALDAGADRVLVDHLAGIPRDASELVGWRADLEVLGALDAVTVKLSGMRSASREALDHLLADTVERVRPERLMWGSDWPVAGLEGADRGELFDATVAALDAAGLTADQSAAVLHGTAADWYGVTV